MTEGPWLDDDEQRAWRSFVAMRQQLERHLERHLQHDAGLSAPDFEVLVNLSEASDGRMRASELGEATGWDKSRLSHHLARMAKRGLLAREPGAGRYPDVVLTDEGRAAITAVAPAHAARVRALLVDVLGPERLARLGAASDDVLAAIDAHRRTACDLDAAAAPR